MFGGQKWFDGYCFERMRSTLNGLASNVEGSDNCHALAGPNSEGGLAIARTQKQTMFSLNGSHVSLLRVFEKIIY